MDNNPDWTPEDEVLNQLRQGFGAELWLDVGKKRRRVVFIPSTLFRPGLETVRAQYELLIVLEGGGAYFYSGRQPLNAFKLVSHGFPMQEATMVADLVRKFFEKRNAASPQMMAHTGETKRLQDSH